MAERWEEIQDEIWEQSGVDPVYTNSTDQCFDLACKRIAELESDLSRATRILSRAHGALADCSTVPVPCSMEGDLVPAIEALRGERDEARAEAERLRDILHRAFHYLPTVPGDALAWVDSDIEPHVVRVADEYRILEEQCEAMRKELDDLRTIVQGGEVE